MHQELVLGLPGQVFEVEASVLPREPVSVLVTSWTGEVQIATTACRIDRVATVLAEDAPRGARVLHVGSTRGITPNTRYDVGGQRFTVYRIDGEHRLILRRPLLEPAKEDAALRGCRILAPVDETWVRDVAKLTDHRDIATGYHLAWTHASGNERTTADLVRTPLHARITPDDIERLFPGWRAAIGDPVHAIEEAAELVRRDVHRHPMLRRAGDAPVVRDLVMLRARIVAVEEAVMFRGAPYSTLVEAEAPYHARIAALQPREPAPVPGPTKAVAVVTHSSRYSLEHVRILDEVTAWFEARTYIHLADLEEFARTYLPRVRTPDERESVRRYLMANRLMAQGKRSKRAGKRWRRLLATLNERVDDDADG